MLVPVGECWRSQPQFLSLDRLRQPTTMTTTMMQLSAGTGLAVAATLFVWTRVQQPLVIRCCLLLERTRTKKGQLEREPGGRVRRSWVWPFRKEKKTAPIDSSPSCSTSDEWFLLAPCCETAHECPQNVRLLLSLAATARIETSWMFVATGKLRRGRELALDQSCCVAAVQQVEPQTPRAPVLAVVEPRTLLLFRAGRTAPGTCTWQSAADRAPSSLRAPYQTRVRAVVPIACVSADGPRPSAGSAS